MMLNRIGNEVTVTNKYAERVKELGGYFVFSSLTQEPAEVSETDLEAAEVELSYPLPKDYREFLRDFSGYTIPATFPFHNVPEDSSMNDGCYVGVMLGLKISSYALLTIYRDDLANMVIAPELLPITSNEAGKICLFLAGPRKGSVHFWWAERACAPYDYANLYFIANSFDEFMQLLRVEDDG